MISGEERGRYEDIFRKADENHTGFVSGLHNLNVLWLLLKVLLGVQARQLFSRSGLPLPDLAKIWYV